PGGDGRLDGIQRGQQLNEREAPPRPQSLEGVIEHHVGTAVRPQPKADGRERHEREPPGDTDQDVAADDRVPEAAGKHASPRAEYLRRVTTERRLEAEIADPAECRPDGAPSGHAEHERRLFDDAGHVMRSQEAGHDTPAEHDDRDPVRGLTMAAFARDVPYRESDGANEHDDDRRPEKRFGHCTAMRREHGARSNVRRGALAPY